jgi:hypothetical protein
MPTTLSVYDIIIGMDWLNKNGVRLDCESKTVTVRMTDGKDLLVHGNKSSSNMRIISTMKAVKCFQHGCLAILAEAVEEKEVGKIVDIPTVQNFPDVFPEDLPRLPRILVGFICEKCNVSFKGYFQIHSVLKHTHTHK